LAWWIGSHREPVSNWKDAKSGGIPKVWGMDLKSAKQQEPFDATENGTENCVYANFSKTPATWYTTDCEFNQRFFVCRDDTVDLDTSKLNFLWSFIALKEES
jgi:hypothetical protein